jgi:hypothetical protein
MKRRNIFFKKSITEDTNQKGSNNTPTLVKWEREQNLSLRAARPLARPWQVES